MFNKNLLGILFSAGVCFVSSSGYAVNSNPTYPIDPADVATTLTRTIVLPSPTPSGQYYPYQISKFGQTNPTGFGNWSYGAGLPAVKRLDIAPGATGLSSQSTKLLRFFTITDVHINDPETPNQSIYFGFCGNVTACNSMVGASSNSSSLSPVMTYTTQVLDAAIQTINIMHTQDPFDLGMALGDAVNNTQYNELRWYINVIDGNGSSVSPHSGSQSGTESFYPAGLDSTINWYQVIGNHDHLWVGSAPVTTSSWPTKLLNAYTGSSIVHLGDLFTSVNTAIPLETHSMGEINGKTSGPNIDLNLTSVGSPPDILHPKCTDWTWDVATTGVDTNRYSLSKTAWMNEFFDTTSKPLGHGFTRDSTIAYYSFKPKAGLKVIVLDDTMPDTLNNGVNVYAYGYLDQTQYNWLVSELDAGQAAGELMIIAAHVPINVVPVDANSAAWTSTSPVSQATVLATLHRYSNLILWISGHRHVNAVTLQPSPDPTLHPELGFWEVETASLRDFPQEFRTFDIYRNNDNTVSIVATDVDPAIKVGSGYPAELSRGYAVAADQMFYNSLSPFWSTVPYFYYNAELVKQLSSQKTSNDNNILGWVIGGAVAAAGAAGILIATRTPHESGVTT